MARKASLKEVPQSVERLVSFRAPDTVHGALKQIVGKLEMRNFRIDGRVPFERDVLNWLIGELYMDGPEKWAERIEKAHGRFVEFAEQN